MEVGSNANGTGGGVGGLSPTISFWFRLNRVILRLCTTHQFKNLQVRIYKHMYVHMCAVHVCLHIGYALARPTNQLFTMHNRDYLA